MTRMFEEVFPPLSLDQSLLDLLGQVTAECLNGRQYSGIGGQLDHVRGSQLSEGGKSIITLASTAKNGTISTIVPAFPAGTAVTVSRYDVNYVVTEYGAVNLKYRTVGEGDTVTSQVPAAASAVPGGSTVILYLGDAAPEESGTVPSVVGLSYAAAREKLESAGFFMRASGVSTYYSNTTTAGSQSVEAGSTAAIGTVVDVQFSNVVEDGAVDLE